MSIKRKKKILNLTSYQESIKQNANVIQVHINQYDNDRQFQV